MSRKTAIGLSFLLLFASICSQSSAAQASVTAQTAPDGKSPVTAQIIESDESQELVKHLDDTNFEKTVKDSKLPVVVDFYATWCEPCKRMSPRLEELAKEYEGKLLVVKVDIDRCPKMKSKYSITRLPTLYLLKPGGATQKFTVGERSLDGLREFVKDAVKQ